MRFMSSPNSPLITLLVPSHKEGTLIRLTCETIFGAMRAEKIEDFEIIVSDCNHEGDGGLEIGKELMRQDPRVRYVRQDGCYNLGYHYAFGLREAKGEFFMMIPGDNETVDQTIRNLLRARDKADLVLSYTENPEVRPLKRRVISKVYIWICNLLFGLNLSYYNGISLIRTSLLKPLLPFSDGFAYSTEIIVRLLKLGHGHTYIEVPMLIYPPIPGRKAAIFRLRNFISVAKTLSRLAVKARLKI